MLSKINLKEEDELNEIIKQEKKIKEKIWAKKYSMAFMLLIVLAFSVSFSLAPLLISFMIEPIKVIAISLPIFLLLFSFLYLNNIFSFKEEEVLEKIKKKKANLVNNSTLILNNYNEYYNDILRIYGEKTIKYIDQGIVKEIVKNKMESKDVFFKMNSLYIKKEELKKKRDKYSSDMFFFNILIPIICIITSVILSEIRENIGLGSLSMLESILLAPELEFSIFIQVVLLTALSIICMATFAYSIFKFIIFYFKVPTLTRKLKTINDEIYDVELYNRFYVSTLKTLNEKEIDMLDIKFVNWIMDSKENLEKNMLSNKERYEKEMIRRGNEQEIILEEEILND